MAVAELARRYPSPRDFAVVDVSSDTHVHAWAGASGRRPVDLLMNNAGVINRNAPLWKVPEEEFSQVVDVNIKGVVNVLRHFRAGDGRTRPGRDRQHQLRLGTWRLAGGRALLRDEMGHRGAYPAWPRSFRPAWPPCR